MLWTPESFQLYDESRAKRAAAYNSGNYKTALEKAQEARDIAEENDDPLRISINMRDGAFALHRLDELSSAWLNVGAAIGIAKPYEGQLQYGDVGEAAPILSPRREQAANHMARLRVGMSALKSGIPIIEGSVKSGGDILKTINEDYDEFDRLLTHWDQYRINGQQDRMRFARLRGEHVLGTYARCIGNVIFSESRFTDESLNKDFRDPSRLKIVARQVVRITQSLL